MEIILPQSKTNQIVGKMGEKIVEHYFRTHDIIVISNQLKLIYVGSIADFVITKNEENKAKFREIEFNVLENLSNHPEYLIYESKRDLSSEENDKLIDRLLKEKPEVEGLTRLGNRYYDLNARHKKIFDDIKNLFCLVEVKTRLGDIYPVIRKSNLTYSQRMFKYYDHLLRVKIDTNLENGLKGTIHPKDIEKLLSNPKLYS